MRSAAAFGVLIVMVTGCGSDRGSGVPYPDGEAATITLAPASTDPMTSTGDTRFVTAVVKDAKGSVISASSLVWRTSAPSVATVSGTGDNATVTAVDDGTAVITASSGGVSGTVAVIVRRRLVTVVLAAPDSFVVAGSTTQLTVVGRDARQNAMSGLTDVSFTSSNPFSATVSPTGLVTALFSSFPPLSSSITATVARDGVVLRAMKRIEVTSAAPPEFDVSALMEPQGVRPEPVNSAAEGIVFLTRNGARVDYKILWSLLTGSPVSAHIHGPDENDTVADVLVDLPLGTQTGANGTASGSFAAADIRSQGGRPAISLDSLFTLIGPFGLAYGDLHSTFFSNGEIRGSIFRRR